MTVAGAHDVVILNADSTADGMDQLFRQQRQNAAIASLPTIVITGIGQKGDSKLVQDKGVSGYLVRPVAATLLQTAIAMVLDDAQRGRRRLVTRHTCAEEGLLPEAAPPPPEVMQVTAAAGSRAKILLVEDNLVNQEVANEYFWELQCDVTVACNGLEAIEAITSSAFDFDVVFMDCLMPVMDGFQATAAIRQLELASKRSRSRSSR